MFNSGLAYASIFSAALTFVVALQYFPAWAALGLSAGIFYIITKDYDEGEEKKL